MKVFHVGPGDLKPLDQQVITTQPCSRCGGTRWALLPETHALKRRRPMRCVGCGWIRQGRDKYGDTA